MLTADVRSSPNTPFFSIGGDSAVFRRQRTLPLTVMVDRYGWTARGPFWSRAHCDKAAACHQCTLYLDPSGTTGEESIQQILALFPACKSRFDAMRLEYRNDEE